MAKRNRIKHNAQFTPTQIADTTIEHTAYAQLAGGINNIVSQELDELVAIEGQKEGQKAAQEAIDTGVNPELKRANTIRGANFNRTVIQSLGADLKRRIHEENQTVLREHAADPKGAQPKLEALRQTFIQNSLPELQPFVQQEFDIQSGRVREKILTNRHALDKREQLDALTGGLNVIEEQAKEAAFENDEEAFIQLGEEYKQTVQAMINGGHITESEGKLKLDIYRQDREVDIIFGQFVGSANPEEFMKNFIKNPPKGIDRTQFIAARNAMNAHLNALDSGKKQRESELKDNISDAIFVLERGGTPENMDQLLRQATEFPDLLEGLAIAQVQSRAMGEFSKMPVRVQQDVLLELGQSDLNTREEIELFERFEKIHDHTQSLLRTDPVKLMAETGENVQPIDVTDVDSLVQRQELAKKINATHGVESSGLTKIETSQISNAIDQSDAAGKLQLIDVFNTGLGEKGNAKLMEDIGLDQPAFVVASGLAKEVPTVSQDIITGESIIKENSGVVPSSDEINASLNASIGNIFPPEVRGQIGKAATALYATRQFRLGETGNDNFSEDDFIQAVEDITGPIVEFNDQPIISPRRDWDARKFDQFVDTLSDTDLQNQGFTPKAGESDVTIGMVKKHGVLVPVSDSSYLILIGDGYATDPNGLPFEWNLKSIADGVTTRELRAGRRNINPIGRANAAGD